MQEFHSIFAFSFLITKQGFEYRMTMITLYATKPGGYQKPVILHGWFQTKVNGKVDGGRTLVNMQIEWMVRKT